MSTLLKTTLVLGFCLLFSLFVSAEKIKTNTLAEGTYWMVTTVYDSIKKTERNEKVEVTLTNEDGVIKIVNAKQPKYPILGRIDRNVFTAHIDDSAGPVELIGEIVKPNTVEGTVEGSSRKDNRTITGTFTLYPR